MPVLKTLKNGVWQPISGMSEHSHTKNDIIDFPSSLPADGGNADTLDGKHANEFALLVEFDEFKEEAMSYTDTKTSGLASTTTVDTKISTHNTSASAHNDIRDLISGLTTRLNTLANSDDTTLDQMSEVVAYIKNNKSLIDGITTSKVNVSDIVNNLTTNVSNKPLSAAQGAAIKALIDSLQAELDSHTHAISDVSGLQSALDGKAESSHGTHVSYSSTKPVMDGTASVGSASTVARSDHKHPTDTSRAAQTDLDTHTGNTTVHITSTERTNWNAAKTHADSAHAPINAEKNQNAFSNVKIGSTTIAADTATDTITLVAGDNVTITPDANGDSITISSTDTNTTYSAGTGISLSGTTFSNSGVRSVATGSTNGTISVNTNGSSSEVAVKGLGSAAYKATSAFDAAGAADTALSNAKTYTDTVASGKADKTHSHAISEVTNLQTTLDGKANSSHGTHVSYSTTTPVMDGTASVGTASTVARSDHKHPTDTSRVAQSDFDTHVADATKHITSTERTNWGTAYTHSQAAHAPSNAQANQNAFSNIAVSGQTTVAADTTTDTVTFIGSNVSITTDATNDKVTFSVADGSTSAKGIVKLENSTSSTSTTTAATPSSVKSAYDLANTAKTNAATAQSKADSAYTLASGKVGSLSDLSITATATELNYMDGVTSNVQAQLDGKAASGHTHNYAGSSSAGGAATSANKINTDAGSATNPVYFSNGIPVQTTYTLEANVPSGAKFTDTVYTHPNYVTKASGLYKVSVDDTGHISGATVVGKSDITALGIPAQDTTYSAATTSAAGLMSAADKAKLDNTNVSYGTCSTAADVAAKVVNLSGNANWKLAVGSIIMVSFTNSNTASNVTLNVNNTGAYPIWYNASEYTSNGNAYTGYAGRVTTYMFNGTHWVWVSNSYDANTQSNTNSTDTSSKIYLVGATSQGSNKTTYSHDTVYAGTDGHAYSNSKQVVNLSDSQALTNKTYKIGRAHV